MGSDKNDVRLTADAIRKRLSFKNGERFWRTLDQLSQADEFDGFLKTEFPKLAELYHQKMRRRDVLKIIGLSFAIYGLTSCSYPPQHKVVPYVHEPEGLVYGHPVFYATAMPLSGYGRGVVVESHMGRPTKIEGNPQHPASLGGTDAFAQASTMSLYDPDRVATIEFKGKISSWTAFSSSLEGELELQKRKGGAGLRILTETITSPALADQMHQVMTRFPKAKWHCYEPAHPDNEYEGSRIAFGGYFNTYYRLTEADAILSLDSDFLTSGPAWLRYAREWSDRRGLHPGPKGMNRLYAIESAPTCTGSVADHKLTVRPSQIEELTRFIGAEIGIKTPMRGDEAGGYSSWLKAAVRDLQRHRGSSAIIPGCFASPAVHALSHAMNAALGNIGSTVVYTDPIEAGPLKHIKSLLELVDDMRRGVVDLLIIIDSNPVYDAPADIGFAKEIKKAAYSVYMGMHGNETAALCRWLVPATHYLESWGDVRAFDGTASIIQPLIAPVYGGISPHSLIAILQGAGNAPAMEIVKSYWRKQINSPDFEKFWEEALKSGILPNTQAPGRSPALKSNWAADWKPVRKGEGVEIVFRPDPAIYDGRFSNNGYLQDLPKPISKLTWDNAAFVSPRTARHLGYNPEELTKTHSLGFESPIVRLKLHGRKVEAPLSILPGHPDATVSVSLGYGRSRAGNIGTGHGFDAYKLRASTALWQDDGLEIEKTEQKMMLAVNQHTWLMHERQADIYRLASWETIQKDPENIKRAGPRAPHKNETLYRTEFNYRNGYQWGLTVDLSKCTGCHACVSACDIENNVPFLNKVETSKGRWMHWLRIDRYYSGEGNNAKILFQPMLCMQCELAPCEYVCPVQATNHSAEGINQMVYNRCVGTKFCSNNCPWKVRRFNFYQYSNYESPSFAPLYNPDVTVRGRGVMEKCNYCIQRIQQIRIVAEMQQRKIEDGEIVMACQAACPTQVFVFGDLNDPDSALSRSAASPVNYATLAELNTRPRTTYLAKIFNPNPEIKG